MRTSYRRRWESHTHQSGAAEGLCNPAHRCNLCSAQIGTAEAVQVSCALRHSSLESVSGFDHGDLGINIVGNAAVLLREPKQSLTRVVVALMTDLEDISNLASDRSR